MPHPWTGYLAGAAFALTATAGAAAYAQSTPRANDADQPRMERHEERRIVTRDGERQFESRRGHYDMAEHLRTMLQLKPAQEGALSAYLAAVRPQHHDGRRVVEMSTRDEGRTTPQKLAEVEARMAENTAAAHARIEATRRFYDQLEPSQKKVFDELPMLTIGPIGPVGPMMLPSGPMKVMINSRHFDFPPERIEPPIPPRPPHPPKSPPAPPAAPAPPAPPAAPLS